MKRLRFSNLTILIPTLLLASIPMVAQMVPQAGPQDGGPDDQGDQQSGPGVARVSLLTGDVSVRHGDTGDYIAAAVNAPVMPDDSVQTGPGARAEVQFDFANLVRLAQNTELRFTSLQDGHFQMQLGRGTITFRVLQNVNAQVEIDTTSIAIRPAQPGAYRITVTDDGQTFVTPRNGQVEIYTPKGSQMITPGQTLVARGPQNDPEYRLIAALPRDDWDTWSDSRDHVFQQANQQTSQYVSPDVYGTEELQGHGQWVNTPDYGYAWAPNVGADWSPYSYGQWAWGGPYGWTWISYDPWGWAPYHYGRWFYGAGYGWCWWPGSIHSHYYWHPAVVGFFGFGGVGVGVGFSHIGWVPLAPHEVYHGWSGGTYYNHTKVNVVNNVNVATAYRNGGVRNGVMSMNAQQFGRGATGITHVPVSAVHSVSAIHGAVPVTPSSQSMRFTNRSTSTMSRTNFSSSQFASHAAVPSNQHSWFSAPRTGQQPTTSRPAQSTGASRPNGAAASGWSRFGQSGPARSFTGGSTSGAGEPAGGWNRFGASGSSVPRNGGSSSTPVYRGAERPQGTPPAPQPRANPGNSGYNAPRYSAPSYSAPRSPAPSYSAPHYSAPSGGGAHQSVNGGGAHSAPSGGGGHSGGGGGHHR